ncbi:hypothetical protein ACFE04_002979 [Oxalis oulophora]
MDELGNMTDQLGLIDINSADDWLLNSPYGSQKETSFQILDESEEDNELGGGVWRSSIHEMDSTPQPLKLLELNVPRKKETCNLRKSLAWDSAFLTNDGFLDAEEMDSMMIGNDVKTEKYQRSTGKSDKPMLPAIQEVVNRSTESFSTLASDTLPRKSCESFGDARSSIQKSTKKATNAASPDVKVGARSSKKVNPATQNRLRLNAAPRKPGAGILGSGKVMRQVSASAHVSQIAVRSRGLAPSIAKASKVLLNGPISTISAKRTSMVANRVKVENVASDAAGRIAKPKTSDVGSLRNTVSRPIVHSRPSLSSSVVSKKDLRTSCSSLDSSESALSNSFRQSSLNSLKKKNEVKMGNNSPSKLMVRTPSKSTSRNKNQPGSPLFSIKLLASTSPVMSISKSPAESSPYNSPKTTNSNKKYSEKKSTKQHPIGSHTQVTRMPDESSKRASIGTSVLRPASTKPTGLKRPSPKIGFFDQVRPSVQNPNRSTPVLPSNGLGINSPTEGSNPLKLQTPRKVAAMCGAKSDVQKPTSSVKSKSPTSLKESSSAATKAYSTLRNVKDQSPSMDVNSRMTFLMFPLIDRGSEANARHAVSGYPGNFKPRNGYLS